jgi:integrase
MNLKKPTNRIVLIRHKTLSNGEHPIKLRITYNGQPRYFSLGLSAKAEHWNDTSCRLKKDKNKANLLLNQKDALADNIILDFERDGVDFTFKRFSDKFFTNKLPTDVLKYLDKHILKLEEDNRLGSSHSYKDLKYRLEDFKGDKEIGERRRTYSLAKANDKKPEMYRRPQITFHDVGQGFIDDFYFFLKQKGNSKNTIGIYLRTLRAVVNKAERDELIREDMNPFNKGYKIASVTPGKLKHLSPEQIMEIKSFQASGDDKEDVDLFLLSYLMDGSNLMDIAKLKWKENVVNGRLVFNRSKTDKLIDIEINNSISEIITGYYGNGPYLFHILEEDLTPKQIRYRIRDRLKRINKTLKKIAPVINLPKEITFYWARHSFSARLYNLGVSLSVIGEMLSHSDPRTTKIYTGRLDKTHLDEARRLL